MGESARIEYVIANIFCAVTKAHLGVIDRRAYLLDSSIDSVSTNILGEHADQFGRVKVISNQPRRLEAM
jgi:hypothetical protein